MSPELIPVDTFDSLVPHNFSIFARQIVLHTQIISQAREKIDADKEFAEVTRHENFPFFSKLWKQITVTLYISEWRKLSFLNDKLSKATWKFLENSEMFPAWNFSSGEVGWDESLDRIL